MNACIFCQHCNRESANADKEMDCKLLNIKVTAFRCCPGFKPIEQTEEDKKERERLLALSPSKQPAALTAKVPAKPKVSRPAAVKQTHETDYEQEIKLFDHQKLAREKFKDQNEIALFFEMGCGKTLTSMMIICDKFKQGLIDNLLVVAPNDVHKQWFDDLCDDNSTLSKAIAQEGVECDGQIIGGRGGQKQFWDFDDNGKLHIVCTNIDTFSTPHKWEVLVAWALSGRTAIIVDEATSIKNPSSKRAQRLLYEFNDTMFRRKTCIFNEKKQNTQVRIVLTGTPVTNGPMDLWAIMEFVKPNCFNRNYYSFMNYYGMHTQLKVEYEMNGVMRERSVQILLTEKTWHGIKACNTYAEAFALFGCSEDTYLVVKHQDKYLGPYRHADELKRMLEPYAVFAKLTDCVDMPECNYIVKKIPLSDVQQQCYDDMKHDLLAQYEDNIATAKNKLTVTLRLQQISSGFIMAHETDEPSPDDPMWFNADIDEQFDLKPDQVVWLGDTNPRLEQLMRDVDESDKPLMIITRFSAEASKIYDMLKDKYATMLFTGWKTSGTMEDFKGGKYEIMVANIAKVARGFNLQIAHNMIFYSNTYSMELRQQTEFRIFRMGQKQVCKYIDYESCPVDRAVNEALSMKKGFLDYMRSKDLKEMI